MVRFLFTFLCIAILGPASSQEASPVQYDSAPMEIQEIKEDDMTTYRNDPKLNYEEVEVKRTWWDDFKAWIGNLFLRFFEWIFGAEKAVGALAVFLRTLPYILLGVLIFILIKFFLKVNANAMKQAKKEASSVSLSEEEHIIKNEDIQELIRKAVANGDYRLAIRYYYLFILQKMTDQELIDWQLQKTNEDYYQEIEASELKTPFRAITRLYDYIWYGGFSLDQKKYSKAELVFLELQQTLDKNA